MGTSKTYVLVPLFHLKFLNGIHRSRRRNFKWAAPGQADPKCEGTGSVHRFETVFFGVVAKRHDSIKPMQLLFEVLIDQHQGFKRPPHIAIT